MFAEYKRDVSHNYLILHGDETINTTSYQVRILTGNTMSSILKCRMQGLDGTWLFRSLRHRQVMFLPTFRPT